MRCAMGVRAGCRLGVFRPDSSDIGTVALAARSSATRCFRGCMSAARGRKEQGYRWTRQTYSAGVSTERWQAGETPYIIHIAARKMKSGPGVNGKIQTSAQSRMNQCIVSQRYITICSRESRHKLDSHSARDAEAHESTAPTNAERPSSLL